MEPVKSVARMWRLYVPVGVGVGSTALVTQWRYLHQHGYPVDVDNKPELLNDFMVNGASV